MFCCCDIFCEQISSAQPRSEAKGFLADAMEKNSDPLKVYWTIQEVLSAADVQMQNGNFNLDEALAVFSQ